jgi:glycosyltransferase involved in cell wall biosynthesis
VKILAIHRYFWPDSPPYAYILRAICERWINDGHKVDVLSSQPSYKKNTERQPEKEMLRGISVRRLNVGNEKELRGLKRILNILNFSFRVFFFILFRKKNDVVMCSTAPPVLLAFAVVLATKLRCSKFIYHCMDIHPEIGRLSGEFKNPVLFRLLSFIDSITCRMSDKIIVLSEDMKDSLKARKNGFDLSIQVLNNFSLPEYDEQELELVDYKRFLKKEGVFRVLFAGNLGRFQNLETLVDAMKLIAAEHPHTEMVFLGEGTNKDALMVQAGSLKDKRILFFDHQPYSVAKKVIEDADMCVVSLAPGVEKYAFPSKTMTYLAAGKPLCTLVDEACALSEMVENKGVGVCLVNGGAKEITEKLKEVIVSKGRLTEMQKKACEAAGAFEMETVLNIWSGVLKQI